MLNTLFTNVLAASTTIDNPAGVLGYSTRQNVILAFMILMAVAAIAMIVVVLMQKGTNDNVGAVTGLSDTYYGKNKAKTNESKLKIITLSLFVFIMICAIIASIIAFI